MDEALSRILQLTFDRLSGFQTLWNLYITVALGVTAFMATAARHVQPALARLVVIVVFLGFAISNLDALDQVRAQREALADLANAKINCTDDAEPLKRVVESGRPPCAGTLMAFHLALDLAIAVLIWLLPVFVSKAGATSRPMSGGIDRGGPI